MSTKLTTSLIISIIIIILMPLLYLGIMTSNEVFAMFAKSGSPAQIEPRWKFEGAVWTAIFSLSLLAVLAYLLILRSQVVKEYS